MAWHLRPVSPREEHQFFNLADLFRWFRDWSRAVPELATPEASTLEQLLDDAESELSSFVRAETASATLGMLRARILKLGQDCLRRAPSISCAAARRTPRASPRRRKASFRTLRMAVR